MEEVKFHAGVELILSRMDSNPDEFGNTGKWSNLIQTNKQWMTKEEKEAINEKMRLINLDEMRLNMMKKILSDREKELAYANATAPQQSTSTIIGNGLTGATWTTNASIALGDKSLTQDNLTTLLELIEKYEEERSAY